MLIILLLFSSICFGQNSFPPIGLWREHLPYQGAVDLTASENKVYCATPFSIFSVEHSSLEVNRISRVSGLSETGISTIRFDPVSKKLYIAYTNSNIDVLGPSGMVNIPDIKRETISGDKSIYHIYPDNTRCYLSTGIGVVVLDAEKAEIRETWFLGNAGAFVKTYGFTRFNGFYYAATEEGLKRIAESNSNPADFNNWQTLSGTGGLPAGAAKAVVSFQNQLVVLQNDSLFSANGSNWNPFFSNGWPIVSINVSENKLFVCQRQNNGNSQVLQLNANGSIARTIQQPGVISFPRNAISVGNITWIADLFGGLSRWTGNSFEVFKPDSPVDVATGGLAIYNNIVYAAAGSVNDSWNYQYNRNGVFRFAEGSWTAFNQFAFPQLDSLLDFLAIAVDPRDESVWAGSFGGGLLHIRSNNQFDIYKQNSPIGSTIGDPGSYRVSGLAFDQDQNLWVSNFGSDRQVHVLKKDGSWRSFTAPFVLNFNAVSDIVIDEAGQKWIASPLGNGLLVFNDRGTIDNAGDDQWRLYRAGTGQGNLPSNEVMSLAMDKSGFLWVGTEDGVGVIQCPTEALVTGCESTRPTIQEGAFTNYLFKGQEVRSIAVDGADRKWIATASGAWLVAPDGDKVLAQFTEENSPLLSNDVKRIAINGKTGEVFFATAKGLISFRGTATEAAETTDSIHVYPNPVPAGYTGTIGIRGLPENSQVKITETGGRLVFQTRSLGGQAVWNGRDYLGRQAASGIYLVLAIGADKTEKVVGKIVLIGR
jgi:sugar lactone lactonase YvrE